MLDINQPPYIETGLNSVFTGAGLSFEEYCLASQEMITQATGDAKLAKRCAAQATGSANSEQVGIVLIHGLLDSPYCMASLFDYFQAQGHCVRSALLPGHGTVVGDLLSVDCSAWQQAAEHAIASLRGKVKKLIVIGYSTGATLALQYAYRRNGIDGLVLFAPALKVRSPLIGITRWYQTICRYWPRAKWLQLLDENDYGRYFSMAMNAAYQVHRLSLQFKAVAHRAGPPMMMITTEDDIVISNNSNYCFFQRQLHPLNRAIHYTTKPKPVTDPRVQQRSSQFKDLKIVDFSHVCLAIAPTHPQWGQHSTFQDFAHYQDKQGQVTKRPRNKPFAMGSLSFRNRRRFDLQRLRYNPDFVNLMQDIDEFIASTKKQPELTQAAIS